MEKLAETFDFASLFIYIAIIFGVMIYPALKSKKKNQNQDNDDIVIQGSNQDNSKMNTGWKSNRKNNYPYQTSRNNTANPIFGNSTTNISYTRTLIIFLAVAVFAVLLIAYFTGKFENYVNFIYKITYY